MSSTTTFARPAELPEADPAVILRIRSALAFRIIQKPIAQLTARSADVPSAKELRADNRVQLRYRNPLEDHDRAIITDVVELRRYESFAQLNATGFPEPPIPIEFRDADEWLRPHEICQEYLRQEEEHGAEEWVVLTVVPDEHCRVRADGQLGTGLPLASSLVKSYDQVSIPFQMSVWLENDYLNYEHRG
jgi:hypothetical protein